MARAIRACAINQRRHAFLRRPRVRDVIDGHAGLARSSKRQLKSCNFAPSDGELPIISDRADATTGGLHRDRARLLQSQIAPNPTACGAAIFVLLAAHCHSEVSGPTTQPRERGPASLLGGACCKAHYALHVVVIACRLLLPCVPNTSVPICFAP